MQELLLSNGNKLPVMGLGTDDVFYLKKLFSCKNKEINRYIQACNYRLLKPVLKRRLAFIIAKAIKMGYRLIDTSSAYDNEECIGKAIKLSGIPRTELYITTRATNKQQYNGTVREGFLKSLKKLDLDYIDLYMLHWPVPGHYLDAWRELEKLYEEGYVRNIGLANCHQHHIEDILKICKVRPVLNQIEVHPLFTQKPLVEYCKSEGIQIEAYTPLARNDERLRRNRILRTIAEKYGKTQLQVILRWHIENGVVPVPRSTNAKRLEQNLEIFDFSLTSDEVKQIDSININSRLRYDPDNCDFTQL
ncbi:aldo/keto reductase [Phocaeicola sp.]